MRKDSSYIRAEEEYKKMRGRTVGRYPCMIDRMGIKLHILAYLPVDVV